METSSLTLFYKLFFPCSHNVQHLINSIQRRHMVTFQPELQKKGELDSESVR